MVAKLVAAVAATAALVVAVALLLGGLTSLLWNHFAFLEALHHMNWWDGFLLNMLCALLFKADIAVKSS